MIISIDIGTSYSSVCLRKGENQAEPVETSTGISIYGSKYSLPSAVFVDEDGQVLVGQAAMNSRKKKPQNFWSEFKRDLGQNIPIVLGDRSFLPEELYTELFRHMKKCAEKSGKGAVEKAYITYPASFGKDKREKIREAAKKAGLFEVELVDEPTAAAMCYKAQGSLEDGDILLVYDFGGGTFDVSLIQYTKGTYEALAPAMGIEHCGGIDIDRAIYADIISKIDSELLQKLSANKTGKMRFEGQLAELAVKIKHHLSNAQHASEAIPIGFDILDYELGRGRLNEMIAGMVSQTLECCKNILDSAGIKIEDISEILLVGGASRVPLVREMVRKFAGSTPVYADVDPDLAVAQGAAVAVALSGESKAERQENQGRICRKCGEKDGAFMRFGGQWYCKDCLKKVMDVSTVYKKEQAVSLYLHSNIAESAVYDACMPEKVSYFPGIDLSPIINSDDIWKIMVHSEPGDVPRRQICQYMKRILAYYKQQVYELTNRNIREMIFIYPDSLSREYVLCIQIAALQLDLKILRMMPVSSAIFFQIGYKQGDKELSAALLQTSPIPIGVGCEIGGGVVEILWGALYSEDGSSFAEFAQKHLLFGSIQPLLYRYVEESGQAGAREACHFVDVTYKEIVQGGAYYTGKILGFVDDFLLLDATRYSVSIGEKEQSKKEYSIIECATTIPTKHSQLISTKVKEFQIFCKSEFHNKACRLYSIRQQRSKDIEQFRIKELTVYIDFDGMWEITATDSTGAAVGTLLDEHDMQYDVWQKMFLDGQDLTFQFKYK